VRAVTLTETGTLAMAGSAAGMLVIMDRGFPGVASWNAYTQADAHLLIRARSCVAKL
jgi:hypothetical protein